MFFKTLISFTAFVSVAFVWEIILYEQLSEGSDANNCQAGGTTVSGTASTCIKELAAINIQSAQAISDSQACAFEMWTGDDCSGTQNNNQDGNCFNALHPTGASMVKRALGKVGTPLGGVPTFPKKNHPTERLAVLPGNPTRWHKTVAG
ncbi:hypothetical protein M422DRAFT_272844 [Sphaerobolus stellatus SS14]|uniref:Uncharacterized protein n=1 Tax=Sphaerobolus stellatus (strain SS14) TaxID=990650 RepID=A0A0C9ULG8_SPHS4|nr:hypothetical protein M422DRAFT_272844 [Sphaerobolus stellatus SS14]